MAVPRPAPTTPRRRPLGRPPAAHRAPARAATPPRRRRASASDGPPDRPSGSRPTSCGSPPAGDPLVQPGGADRVGPAGGRDLGVRVVPRQARAAVVHGPAVGRPALRPTRTSCGSTTWPTPATGSRPPPPWPTTVGPARARWTSTGVDAPAAPGPAPGVRRRRGVPGGQHRGLREPAGGAVAGGAAVDPAADPATPPTPLYAIPGNHDWYDGLTGLPAHVRPGPVDRRLAHPPDPQLLRRAAAAPLVAVGRRHPVRRADRRAPARLLRVGGRRARRAGDRWSWPRRCRPGPSSSATRTPTATSPTSRGRCCGPRGLELRLTLAGDLHHYARYEQLERQPRSARPTRSPPAAAARSCTPPTTCPRRRPSASTPTTPTTCRPTSWRTALPAAGRSRLLSLSALALPCATRASGGPRRWRRWRCCGRCSSACAASETPGDELRRRGRRAGAGPTPRRHGPQLAARVLMVLVLFGGLWAFARTPPWVRAARWRRYVVKTRAGRRAPGRPAGGRSPAVGVAAVADRRRGWPAAAGRSRWRPRPPRSCSARSAGLAGGRAPTWRRPSACPGVRSPRQRGVRRRPHHRLQELPAHPHRATAGSRSTPSASPGRSSAGGTGGRSPTRPTTRGVVDRARRARRRPAPHREGGDQDTMPSTAREPVAAAEPRAGWAADAHAAAAQGTRPSRQATATAEARSLTPSLR